MLVTRHDRWFSPNPYVQTKRYFDWLFDVWHYTDRAGLDGIVSSNVLWATESGGLNDPSEVVLACDDLLATWEAQLENLVPNAPVDETDAWLRQITAETKARRFFFVSACSEGDKLHHWTTYAGGTGYALELERNSEFRLLQPQSAPALCMPAFAPFPWWRPVDYGPYYDDWAPSRGRFFGRNGIMEPILNEFAAKARGDVTDEVLFWDELERQYVTSVCLSKHQGYEGEHEVRLVFAEPPLPDYVHHRAGRFGRVRTAYMEVAADCTDPQAYSVAAAAPLPIKTVRIGPRYATDVEQEVRDVTDLLRDHGYLDVAVTTSAIPYRG